MHKVKSSSKNKKNALEQVRKSRPFAPAPPLLVGRGEGSTCKVFCQETQMVTVSSRVPRNVRLLSIIIGSGKM